MEFTEIVEQRRSITHFVPGTEISDAELAALFEQVIPSPSSFNLQHWRFVAVRDSEIKKQLRAASWGQEQVETGAAVIAICGKLDAHEDAPEIYADQPEAAREKLLPLINQFYDGNEALMRDETLRSISLAAMALMFAAKDRGWDTCPMIGYDPNAVTEILGLPANCPPLMLVVIGKSDGTPRPRPARLPIDEVVRLERFDGPGLEC